MRLQEAKQLTATQPLTGSLRFKLKAISSTNAFPLYRRTSLSWTGQLSKFPSRCESWQRNPFFHQCRIPAPAVANSSRSINTSVSLVYRSVSCEFD